jgi:nucleoside-diphosphate-sugar epimerase
MRVCLKRLRGTVNSWQAEFEDAFAGKRVLVTGASGFVGGHLCDALLALGADVYGMDSQGTGCPAGCQSYMTDLKDLAAVRDMLSHVHPHLVYHLAGLVTAQQEMDLVLPMLHNNLVGAVHLFLALAEMGCERVVTISSSEEPTDGAPTSPYAASKAAARFYAGLFQRAYGLPVVVAKLFMVFGPRQRSDKLIPYTVISLLRGESPKLTSGTRICDFVYVLDVVRGLLKAGLQPNLAGQTVELGTGTGTCIKDVAVMAADLVGGQLQPVFGAVPDRAGEQPQVADLAITRVLLGWVPRASLREGLAETVAWYRITLEDVVV